jgi:hypothetical protein
MLVTESFRANNKSREKVRNGLRLAGAGVVCGIWLAKSGAGLCGAL